MIMKFKKHPTKERQCRDYRYFDQTKFKNDLNGKLSADITNMDHLKKLSLTFWTNTPHWEKISIELIMPHTWQKPWGKLLCVDLKLRQNISKLKLKPTSNYTKSRKTFAVNYAEVKKENMSQHKKKV